MLRLKRWTRFNAKQKKKILCKHRLIFGFIFYVDKENVNENCKFNFLVLTENISFKNVMPLSFQMHGLFPKYEIEKASCGSNKDTNLYLHVWNVIVIPLDEICISGINIWNGQWELGVEKTLLQRHMKNIYNFYLRTNLTNTFFYITS